MWQCAVWDMVDCWLLSTPLVFGSLNIGSNQHMRNNLFPCVFVSRCMARVRLPKSVCVLELRKYDAFNMQCKPFGLYAPCLSLSLSGLAWSGLADGLLHVFFCNHTHVVISYCHSVITILARCTSSSA